MGLIRFYRRPIPPLPYPVPKQSRNHALTQSRNHTITQATRRPAQQAAGALEHLEPLVSQLPSATSPTTDMAPKAIAAWKALMLAQAKKEHPWSAYGTHLGGGGAGRVAYEHPCRHDQPSDPPPHPICSHPTPPLPAPPHPTPPPKPPIPSPIPKPNLNPQSVSVLTPSL